MNTNYQTTPAHSQARAPKGVIQYAANTTMKKKPSVPAASTGWKPEPCPLTREELRRIIIRQIG